MTISWQNITDPIFHYAAERPDAPAVIEGGSTLSYREFATLVGKASLHLRDRGIRPGDRVGVSLATSVDHLIVSFALVRIGAILIEMPVPLRDEPRQAELARKFGIGRMFVEANVSAPPPIESIPIHPGWRYDLEGSGDFRHVPGETDPCLILLSSGSTGLPKGAITTHRQLAMRVRAALEAPGWDRILSAQRPGMFLLTGSLGFSGFHVTLWMQIFVGGPVVLLPEFLRSAELVRAIASWDDAVCVVTPNLCRAFVALAPPDRLLFPKVRALITLGLPLFAAEKRAVVERVTPIFFDWYGTSAAGGISFLGPVEMIEKGESVGRPVPFTEVEIADAAGNCLPPGAIGRLRCRGPALSTKFYGEESGLTAADGFRDGWYYPGEIAALDEAGYIHIKGRVSDIITRRGIEVFPSEIEAVLLAHPVVEEAAVVGRPATDIGEAVIAFVKLREPLDHQVLAAYCADRLPPEKRPNGLFFAKELPRTGTGKIDRDRLKTMPIGKDARPAGS